MSPASFTYLDPFSGSEDGDRALVSMMIREVWRLSFIYHPCLVNLESICINPLVITTEWPGELRYWSPLFVLSCLLLGFEMLEAENVVVEVFFVYLFSKRS